jgi:hypothetical protein
VSYLRIFLIVSLLALGPIGYMKGRMDGKRIVKMEWQAAVSQANVEARRFEQLRQSRVDEAARMASGRDRDIRADAARARLLLVGLRESLIFANRAREESAAAAAKRASALGELLAASAEAHRELAQRCDRHVNDLRMLLEAWPN